MAPRRPDRSTELPRPRNADPTAEAKQQRACLIIAGLIVALVAFVLWLVLG